MVSVDKWTDCKSYFRDRTDWLADGFSVDERKGGMKAVRFLALSAG